MDTGWPSSILFDCLSKPIHHVPQLVLRVADGVASGIDLLESLHLRCLWVLLRLLELVADPLAVAHHLQVVEVVDEELRVVEQDGGGQVGLEEVLQRLVLVLVAAAVLGLGGEAADLAEDGLDVDGECVPEALHHLPLRLRLRLQHQQVAPRLHALPVVLAHVGDDARQVLERGELVCWNVLQLGQAVGAIEAFMRESSTHFEDNVVG
jgi:hypothetical protein